MVASAHLPAVFLTCIVKCFFNASHCYFFLWGVGKLFLEMIVFLKSTASFSSFFFLSVSCLQPPLRDLDSLVMAGIQVLSLSFRCVFWALSEPFCIWSIFCQDGGCIFTVCAKCFCGSSSKLNNLISPLSESKEQATLLTGNVLIWCCVEADIIPLNLSKFILFLRFNSPS